jgi:hypothetical protein
MAELAGFLEAVGEFETALTGRFGLRREDLRWLALLAESPDGVSVAELRAAARGAAGRVEGGLETLRERGDLDGDDERLALRPAAQEAFRAGYGRVETAYVGLHRYGGEELGVVRTFLREGRRFYERQTARLARS